MCYAGDGITDYFPQVTTSDTLKVSYDVYLYENGVVEVCSMEEWLIFDQNSFSWVLLNMLPTSINELTFNRVNNNKIYDLLGKELNEIPKLFAYPFGEANDKVFQILKDYGFKASFGQYSGVINETSDFNYLPRFSLNEKYGDIERVKFSSNAKGMGVYDLIPTNPEFNENPPFIGFSLLDKKLANIINCFVYDTNGNVDLDLYNFEERIEIRLNRKLKEGRVRMNCTAKEKENWRWFGHQFIVPKYLN